MKNASIKATIFPHVILLIGGRLLLSLGFFCGVIFVYIFVETIATPDFGWGLASVIMYFPLYFFFVKRFWPIYFGELVITDNYVKFKGFLLHSRILYFSEIKHLTVRKMGAEDVVKDMYNTGHMYLLISKKPLPNVSPEKIAVSDDTIKFHVTPKACAKLATAMPEKYSSLFLYYAGE